MTSGHEDLVRREQGPGGTAPLAILVGASILGGEHQVGSLVVLLFAGVCLAWGASGGRIPFSATERMLAIVLGAAAILAALQLLPFPSAWFGGEFRAALDADLALAGAPPWRGWSLDPAGTIRGMTGLVMVAGTWIAARRLSSAGLDRILTLLIVLAAAMAGWGIAESIGKPDTTGAEATFENRNQFAAFMAMVIPFAVALAGRERAPGPIRWFAVGAAGLLLIGALMTFSRAGSALAVGAMAASAGLLTRQRTTGSRLHRWLAGVSVLVAAMLALALVFDKLSARWASPAAGDLRWSIAELGIAAARELWPWGGGIGSFRWIYQGREASQELVQSTHAAYAHNELIQLAVEAGLPGVLLGGAFVAVVATGAMRAWRAGTGLTIARAAAISAVVPILHSLVDAPLRAPACAVLMGLVLALLLGPMGNNGESSAATSRHFR